jgi:MoaA/NifB/PqqE/SkfB family radical SAM enzyme
VNEALLDCFERAGIGHLILTGGEPLLLSSLEDTIRLIKKKGFSILLLTNGDLLSLGRLESIGMAGLDGVSLSLDSLAEGGEGKAPWDAICSLGECRSLSGAVIVPVTRANLDILEDTIRRIHRLGLYTLLQPAFVPRENPLYLRLSLKACSPGEGERFQAVLKLWASLYGHTRYVDLLTGYYTREVSRPTCTMGTQSIVVDSNGDVFPCFHRRDLKVGNLLHADPAPLLARAFTFEEPLASAPCFGEHCLSLFSHL